MRALQQHEPFVGQIYGLADGVGTKAAKARAVNSIKLLTLQFCSAAVCEERGKSISGTILRCCRFMR